MRILLICDDDASGRSLKLVLNESFNVDTTHIGREGIDLGALQGYDLILLDLKASVPASQEILRLLRSSKMSVPLLVLLDHAASLSSEGIREDECLVKPFHRDDLLTQIRERILPPELRRQSLIKIGDLVINRTKEI